MKILKSTRANLLALGAKLNRQAERQLLNEMENSVVDLKRRFWWKVQIKRFDECWIWKGTIEDGGYGRIQFLNRILKPHRISYIFHYKMQIEDGLYVCHKCDNKICVNPYHLWLGTNQENQLDAVQKGRNYMPLGELAPSCKLKSEQVLEIRKLISEGVPERAVAKNFGMSYQQINRIKLRTRWKHI